MKSERLDLVLLSQHPQYSRTLIARAITDGAVFVNGVCVTKPGTKVKDSDVIQAQLEQQYVGFAGYKLAAALEHFKIDVANRVCLDAGLSTGGFSDCLLQNGAQLIYGVDVGSAQIHSSLRSNQRLIVMEQTDIRSVAKLPHAIDLCCLDLSFISLKLVIPSVEPLFSKTNMTFLVLIKPQFEVGREFVGSAGIVRSDEAKKGAIQAVVDLCKTVGFSIKGVTLARRKEATGNDEFFLCCER
jgi:23S rRNA (cytidine1920-2'-O)/16S rRNA (cytidine1409-2'-O)-methyltransferase